MLTPKDVQELSFTVQMPLSQQLSEALLSAKIVSQKMKSNPVWRIKPKGAGLSVQRGQEASFNPYSYLIDSNLGEQ